MRDAVALSVEDLLAVWDRAADAGPVERALALRSAAEPDRPMAEVAAEPLGERDRVLLGVLAATFGADAVCAVECSSCGATGELDLDLDVLAAAGEADPIDLVDDGLVDDEQVSAVGDGAWELAADDWTVRFRLPTTADLQAATAAAHVPAGVAGALRSRVLLAATPPPGTPAGVEVPGATWARVERAMGRLDPLGELRLVATCHACGERIDALMDAAAFLWRRLDVEVRALLAEVEVLARAYGWSERDVLALAPARRRHYVERLRS